MKGVAGKRKRAETALAPSEDGHVMSLRDNQYFIDMFSVIILKHRPKFLKRVMRPQQTGAI